MKRIQELEIGVLRSSAPDDLLVASSIVSKLEDGTTDRDIKMTADNRPRLVASYQFIAGGWEEDKDLTSQSSDKFTTGLSRQSDRILLVLGAKLLVVTV